MILKNILTMLIPLAIASLPAHAQIYFTKNGFVSFNSKTILENIHAENNQVISVLNIQTGEVRFSIINRAFYFPKAKMEEDFNESYMESERYPRSEFSGVIARISDINFEKDSNWAVFVSGDLKIHGITQKVSVPGQITIKNGSILASATFKIFIKDYGIKIPSIVSQKIAESVEVKVECKYQKK